MEDVMKHIIHVTGFFLILGIFLIGCDSVVDSDLQEEVFKKGPPNVGTQALGCQVAGGTGLTAVFVNESVVGATIDLEDLGCDMAIYFDENAPKNAVVRNTTIIQTPGTNVSGTGVWNNGANVTVTNSTFLTDVTGQFVPIRYDNGAKGTISRNDLTGTHRVGILVRGTGTEVDIRGNMITGSGAKPSGWAENGIQIDQGATAKVVNNTLEGHWWDGESNWASTAILLWTGTNVGVTNNILVDNEFSIFVVGDNHKITGNRTSSEIVSQSSFDFRAYGLLIAGSHSHFAGNRFTAENGAVGIYIFPGAENNRITGNRVDGFQWPIVDGGDDTMIRGKPTPIF